VPARARELDSAALALPRRAPSPFLRPRLPRSACLAAALAALGALGGCRSLDAASWNLDELHQPEGSAHKREASLVSAFEYNVRTLIAGTLSNRESRDRILRENPKAVDDPADRCLANVLKLARYDASDVGVSGVQVEWYARLATEDPWGLTRERCTIELGKAGERLAIGLPAGLRAEETPVGAEELSEAVARLLAAARPALEGRDDERTLAELDAAARALEGMTMDLAGARRALRALTTFVRRGRMPRAAREPLERASLAVQRETIRQALAKVLRDPSPRVRAAAVEAAVTASGKAVLDVFLQQMRRDTAPEVHLAILAMVERHGLPDASDVPEGQSVELVRHDWLEAIYRTAMTSAEGQVRVRAMEALARVSGADLSSLREEDWREWWVTTYLPTRDAGASPPVETGRPAAPEPAPPAGADGGAGG
jgi:hypothetical protein